MKTLKYIALSLLVAASTTACKDDPELLTTDVGPEMTVVSADASGVYGGKVDFEVTMTDRYALSTLKAQVFFDDEMVAEEVIRTKSDGTYTGAVTLPFYKNIPDGEATLRFVGQNVRFGTTPVDRPLAVSRPKPAYLTFFLDDAEYRMEPTGNDYEYAVTDEFPQKPQGYIATPELDAAGSVVTFGYDSGAGGIVSDSTDAIPFANSNAGEFTITFNLLTFEGSPFIKLLFGETEMTMVDNDNYSIVTTLTKGRTYTLTGVSDFADWDVDRDFFERADVSDPETLTFLPMTGMYKVTANFKHRYLKIEAMKSATELATLNDDGSGAIWAIGGMEVGKPTLKNAASWSPEDGGLCLARVADKKYQLTLVAGISLNASSFDFKFFHQKTWGGEFGGKDISRFGHPGPGGGQDARPGRHLPLHGGHHGRQYGGRADRREGGRATASAGRHHCQRNADGPARRGQLPAGPRPDAGPDADAGRRRRLHAGVDQSRLLRGGLRDERQAGPRHGQIPHHGQSGDPGD